MGNVTAGVGTFVSNTTAQLSLDFDGSNKTALVTNATGDFTIAATGSKVTVQNNLELGGNLLDENDEAGTAGQILSTTTTGVDWIDAPSSLPLTCNNDEILK